jgi:hypothetical protein
MATDRLQTFPYIPTASSQALNNASATVANEMFLNPGLSSVVNSSVTIPANTLSVEASNVAVTESTLHGLFGFGLPVQVTYAAQPMTAYSGRNRSSGRLRAGDRIMARLGGGKIGECTAGFGAYEDRQQKSNGEDIRTRFLLTAGHCYALGATVERTPSNAENGGSLSEWTEVGRVARRGIELGKYEFIGTDGEAVRLEGGDLAKPPVQAARPAEIGEYVCASGARTAEVHCGHIVGLAHPLAPPPVEPQLWWVLVVKLSGLPGDSGGPVWDPATGAAIGSISGGPYPGAPTTYVTPLIHPNVGATNAQMPGILHGPNMSFNPLRLIVGG